MAKAFVIDRTVLRSDPKAVLSFADNVVIIPGHVVDELENQPEGGEALRIIDELMGTGDISKGVATPGGGVIVIDNRSQMQNNSLIRPTTNDNTLICVALRWRDIIRSRQQSPQQKTRKTQNAQKPEPPESIVHRFAVNEIRVVSKRWGFRVKASSYGIPADDYFHNKMVQSASEISSGMAIIQVNPGNFREFSRLLCESGPAGTLREDFDGLISTPELYANQCCVFEADQGKNILAIYKDDGEESPRFIHVSKPQPGLGVQPRNIGQAFELALLRDPLIKLNAITGVAGSGKTLLSLLAGLEAVVGTRNSQLLIYRPNVEIGRELGFLPGTLEEKMEPWKRPIFDAFKLLDKEETGLKDKKSAFNIKGLLKTGQISIEPINFIQGRTLQDEFLVVDEAQNLTPNEITMVATRVGERATLVLTGDVKQVANEALDVGTNGLTHVVKGMCGDPLFGHITLKDSVRSKLAQSVVMRLQ